MLFGPPPPPHTAASTSHNKILKSSPPLERSKKLIKKKRLIGLIPGIIFNISYSFAHPNDGATPPNPPDAINLPPSLENSTALTHP